MAAFETRGYQSENMLSTARNDHHVLHDWCCAFLPAILEYIVTEWRRSSFSRLSHLPHFRSSTSKKAFLAAETASFCWTLLIGLFSLLCPLPRCCRVGVDKGIVGILLFCFAEFGTADERICRQPEFCISASFS